MAQYVLHCFAHSGNTYKPALMLALAGADRAPRFVDYFHGETGTPTYRERNVARIRSQPGWAHPYELMPGHPLPSTP